MTVCEYFLQGRCRFGQNCRYEHSYNEDDKNIPNSVITQQQNAVIKKIAEAVILAEKGGQWPLSCFSPLKEGPNIPGWEDYSPEEVRWKMYQARANGTLNQCTQEVLQLYNHAEKMRNLFKKPTMENINLIMKMLKGKRKPPNSPNPFTHSPTNSTVFGGSQSGTSQNIFGNSNSSSGNIFGGTTSSTGSIFGGQSASTGNLFGGSNTVNQGNIFGGSTTSNQGSIFGGSATNSTAQGSIFGSATNTASQGSIFGGQPTNTTSQGSIFGGTPTTPGSQGSIFGGSNAASGGSFGGTGSFSNSNTFGNSQNFSQNAFTSSQTSNQNIFSSATTSDNTNIFQKPAISGQNIFSKPGEVQNAFLSTGSGIFSNQTSNSIFGGGSNDNSNQKQENVFGKTDIFSRPFQSSDNNFTSLAHQNSFSNNKQFDSSIYSKVEDLTEDEIKSFTSATFAFAKIPLKPPPQEYCK